MIFSCAVSFESKKKKFRIYRCHPVYWRSDAPRAITIGGPMVSHTE